MALVAITCPTCHAPIDPPAHPSGILKCRFCSSSFRDTSAEPAKTRIVHAVFIDRVGPSNRLRAASVLAKMTHVTPADAERLVASAPCELVALENREHAEELRFELDEAGVSVRIEERHIVIPPPVVLPDRSIHLESAGANKAAVMKVLRAHLDCDLTDAKRIVDRAPCVVAQAVEGGHAKAIVEALAEAGASARLDVPS